MDTIQLHPIPRKKIRSQFGVPAFLLEIEEKRLAGQNENESPRGAGAGHDNEEE